MAARRRKPVRLLDVARAAEISVAAASMAIADHPRIGQDTKRRVIQVVRELGYRRPRDNRPEPARKSGPRAARRGLKRLGFLLVGDMLGDEVNVDILEALTAATRSIDAHLALAAIDQVNDAAANQIAAFASAVDGLLISGTIDQEILRRFSDLRLPVVVLGHVIGRPAEDALSDATHRVVFNELAMSQLATARLLACGHRRVAFISESLPQGLSHNRWLMGYQLAHLEAGVPLDPQLVQVAGKPLTGGSGLAQAVCDLADPPTALVVPDARLAASFLDAMRARGRAVPRDAVVVGAAKRLVERYGLESLPRIVVDGALLVRVAVDRLIRIHDQPHEPAVEIVVPFAAYDLPAGTVSADA